MVQGTDLTPWSSRASAVFVVRIDMCVDVNDRATSPVCHTYQIDTHAHVKTCFKTCLLHTYQRHIGHISALFRW